MRRYTKDGKHRIFILINTVQPSLYYKSQGQKSDRRLYIYRRSVSSWKMSSGTRHTKIQTLLPKGNVYIVHCCRGLEPECISVHFSTRPKRNVFSSMFCIRVNCVNSQSKRVFTPTDTIVTINLGIRLIFRKNHDFETDGAL